MSLVNTVHTVQLTTEQLKFIYHAVSGHVNNLTDYPEEETALVLKSWDDLRLQLKEPLEGILEAERLRSEVRALRHKLRDTN